MMSLPENCADAFVKLADYHRKAMETRRAIEFRALLAVLALEGYIFVEANAIFELLNSLGPQCAKVVLLFFVVTVYGVYLWTMVEIEKRNRNDWRRYLAAEMRAWNYLDKLCCDDFYADLLVEGKPIIPYRKLRSWLFKAWAFWSAVLIAGPVMCSAAYRVWAITI